MFTRCAFSVRFAPIFKSAVLSFSVIKLDTNLKKPNEWGSLKSEFGPKLSTISKDLKPVTVGKDSVLNLLWKYLKKEWFLVTSIVVITAVNSALAVSLPSLISKLMYSINLVNATKLFSAFLLRSIVMVFNTQLLFALGERMAFDLKRDLFRAIIVRDLEWFDGRFEHDILSRLESDTIELKHNIKQFIAIGLRSVFEITGSVITLFYINFKLSLILTMYLPIVYAALSVYGFHLRALSKKCKLIEQV